MCIAALLLAAIFHLTGCALGRVTPDRTFDISFTTTPPGAKVCGTDANGKTVVLGTTPCCLKVPYFSTWGWGTFSDAERIAPSGQAEQFWAYIWPFKGSEPVRIQLWGTLDANLTYRLVMDGWQEQIATVSVSLGGSGFEAPLANVHVHRWLSCPDKPEATLQATIDSLPSGAAVYALSEGGKLGTKFGVTPYLVTIGIARTRNPNTGQPEGFMAWTSSDLGPRFLNWAAPTRDPLDRVIAANYALVKDGYAVYTAAEERLIALRPGSLPSGISPTVTVPLETPAEAANSKLMKAQAELVRMQAQLAGQQANAAASAQQEYDMALAAYNQALARKNGTQTGQDVFNLGRAGIRPGSPSGTVGLVLLGGLMADAQNRDADRDVAVAYERLKAAEAKLVRR